jgi:hypothetical protein
MRGAKDRLDRLSIGSSDSARRTSIGFRIWDMQASYVSPGETVLLFDRYVGPDDTNGDLFVSFRLADGSWSEAQAVEVVNSDVTELAASLSPDTAYEFGGLAKLASYSPSDQKKRFRRFFQATARTAVARVAVLRPGTTGPLGRCEHPRRVPPAG